MPVPGASKMLRKLVLPLNELSPHTFSLLVALSSCCCWVPRQIWGTKPELRQIQFFEWLSVGEQNRDVDTYSTMEGEAHVEDRIIPLMGDLRGFLEEQCGP